VVEYHEQYRAELEAETEAVRVAVIAASEALQEFGPQLGRPYVDTLKGSSYPNMKEMRITVLDGEWRSLLPSIRGGGRFCSAEAVSRAWVEEGFMKD
jgi:hypothetical protein